MKLQLLDIRLRKAFFVVNEEVLVKAKQNRRKFNIKADLRIDVSKDKNQNETIGVELNVVNDDKESPFNFDITYEGIFRLVLKEEAEDEQIKRVGMINCAAIIFPYLRECLADLTRRAGLPPYHIPPINFVKLYEEHKSKSSND